MKKNLKPILFALVATAVTLTGAKAQLSVDSSSIDTTGTITQATGGFIATGAISSSFITASDDDLLVVELSYRDTNAGNNLPSTLSYDGLTLNSGISAISNAANGSLHEDAIYYAYYTPGSLTGSNTITGTLANVGSSGYSLSAFGVTGANPTFIPTVASGSAAGADTVGAQTNTLTLTAVNAGDLTFAVAIDGVNNGSTLPTYLLSSSDGTFVQQANSSDALFAAASATPYASPSTATAQFANGYVLDTATGSETYTVTSSVVTGNKDVLAVLDFSAVPEPSTWAMLIGGLGLLFGVQMFRRQRRA